MQTSPSPEFRQLGDHVVLDMINTIEQSAGGPLDRWQSDADVQAWLMLTGLAPARRGPPKGLLNAARDLREHMRELISRRKAGQPLKPAALNRALAAGRSHLTLVASAQGGLALQRQYEMANPAQWLLPAAEACADFLVHSDFDLVRKCESDACSLWFYDRTRSHRRRWCSMALCGNRHKVAAFRQRETDGQSA